MRPPLVRHLAALAAIAAIGAIGAIGATTSAASAVALAPTASARPAALACPSASTPNGIYVAYLYEQILDRCPDGRGGRYWTARLDAGTSRWAAAEALDTSTENLGRNNVDQLYAGLLERAPSATERARWIDHIRRDHEDAVPTATLMSSAEGYALHTTASDPTTRDQEWLTFAYNRVLDRNPDPAGAAHYLGGFRPGGSTTAERMHVAMSLERSTSNARSWVKAAMAEALGRPADPSGVAYWVGWLTGRGHWQTFRLWTHQLASDEAYRHAQALAGH